MYSYTYDKKTGGILLNSSPTGFSKEPRPVYAPELDVLGFDKHWKYDKQTDRPYMWAEANNYYYRGRLVAKLKGGNVYTAPEIIIPNGEDGKPVMPEPKGKSLCPVDIEAMVEANRAMLEIIEQTTVKKILAVYIKYKDRLDCFHVAFSGGKDSCVLLDLVKKALPKGSFVVVFGDTGMEFPDTYEVIEKTQQQCAEDEIPFYIAKSHLNPKESWKLFGPPSRVLRWCCSVHKSAPQTLRLREITGKDDYTGLAFVGVRAHESATRAEYDYENYGKKQKGQFSHNSILEWTSAEIWLYTYANEVSINEAYKKGNSRVGCLLCPMGANRSDYVRSLCYPDDICNYTNIIKETIDQGSIVSFESYIANGGWVSRGSARDLMGRHPRYREDIHGDTLRITVTHLIPNWREWLKTLGELPFEYTIESTKDACFVEMPVSANRTPYAKLLKQVMLKSAYCVGCRVCEASCRNGCISFEDGLHLYNCTHCGACHVMPYGCYVADSLKTPMERKRVMGLNTFEEHAPKSEWIADFFKRQDAFLQDNSLGPNQKTKFKRFLSDALLINKNSITDFTSLITRIGWESKHAWGLILVNLVNNNPQMRWYADNLPVGISFSRKTAEEMLTSLGQSEKMARAIVLSFKRLSEIPIGTTLHWGYVADNGDLVRTKCSVSDPRVVLYALFKFAEKCNGYKEFTLATLLNDSIPRDGSSPTRIFGLDRDDMMPLLLGLSARYPEFITASFTHDLEKITLAEEKSSQDVLDLFEGDAANA